MARPQVARIQHEHEHGMVSCVCNLPLARARAQHGMVSTANSCRILPWTGLVYGGRGKAGCSPAAALWRPADRPKGRAYASSTLHGCVGGKQREEEREIEEEDGASKRDNGVDILCHISSDEWAILVIITINLKAYGDLGFLKQPTTRLVVF